MSVIIGSEQALTSPTARGIWLKTHITRSGTHLVATTYVVSGGDFEVFKLELDVAPIMKLLMKRAGVDADKVSGDIIGACLVGCDCENNVGVLPPDAISGFSFGSITRFAKKAWKSGAGKLARKVARAGKSIIKSKITQGIVAAAAVAVPAIGIPAAAALAAANVAVNAIESGKKVARDAHRIARKLKSGSIITKRVERLAKRKGANVAKAYIAKNPGLKRALEHARKFRALVKKTLTKARKKQIAKALKKAQLAKQFLAKVSQEARFGKGQSKIDAQKMARIVRIAAKNQSKIRQLQDAMKGGIPAILVDDHGKLRKGRYVTDTKGTADVLVTRGGIESGRFKKYKVSKARLARLELLEKKRASLKKKLSALKKTAKGRAAINKALKKKVAAAKKKAAASKKRAAAVKKLKSLPPKKKRAIIAKLRARKAAGRKAPSKLSAKAKAKLIARARLAAQARAKGSLRI